MTARPSQYFAPNTGQRAYTFTDIFNGINDQINGINDQLASTADSGVIDNIYADSSSDTLGASDSVRTTTTTASQIVWDSTQGYEFYQGAWK